MSTSNVLQPIDESGIIEQFFNLIPSTKSGIYRIIGQPANFVENGSISYNEEVSPYLNSIVCGIENGAIISRLEGHTTANLMEPDSISFPPFAITLNLIS